MSPIYLDLKMTELSDSIVFVIIVKEHLGLSRYCVALQTTSPKISTIHTINTAS